MATTTSINQTGNATATFSIGDGPLNSNVSCSSALSVTIDPSGNWTSTINLYWQDPQTTDWWWFYFEGTGTSGNTTVNAVGVMESTGNTSGNILNEWGYLAVPGGAGIPASINWGPVPDGYAGTWTLSLTATDITNTLDSNGPDLTVKFASVTIDVIQSGVQVYHGGLVAEEYVKAQAANIRAALRHPTKRPKRQPAATAGAATQASPLWSVPAKVMPETNASFGLGSIFYAGEEGYFHAFDFHTGNPLWTAKGIDPGPLQSPVYTNLGGPCGAVLATDDSGNLYFIDPVAGGLLWQIVVNQNTTEGLSNPVVAPSYTNGWANPQTGVYVTDGQYLYFIAPGGNIISPGQPTKQTVYPSSSGINPQATPAYDPLNHQLVVAEGDGLTAISLATWQAAWSTSCTTSGSITAPMIGGGQVYVGTPQNTVVSISLSTGAVVATSPQLEGLIENPVAVTAVQGGYQVFVVTQGGWLYCLDGAALTVQWSVQPIANWSNPLSSGTQLITAPVISDGILYVAGSNETIYGLPLTEQGQTAITAQTGSAISGLAGVSNGTAYFATEAGIAAANFQVIAKAFLVHCDFIQDFADNTPGTATQVSNYHCHLTLFDGNNNPVPGETIQVTSDENVTITVNSTQTYTIGPSSTPSTANISADSSGKIVITAQASTTAVPGASSCLSTPMLAFWGSFMGQTEQILVYPDQPLHNKLTSISATDLQNATGYPASQGAQGTPMLPTGYQGSAGLSNAQTVANCINNMASGTQNSALMRAVASVAPYMAFPNSNSAGVTYSATPPSSYSRPAVSGAVPTFIVKNLNGGTPTFAAATDDEIQQYINSLQPQTAADFWSDLESFCENVVNDVETVVSYAVQAATNAINVIVQGAENLYQFTVSAIEDAVNVLVGVLKSIVNDIELVIQALSYLFDFSDILATHGQISTIVQNMLSSLQSNITTNLLTAGSNGQTALQTFFSSIEGDVNSWFGNSALTGIQSNSLSQVQAPYADPSQAYNQNGHDNNVACTSMSGKANSNMAGTTVGSPANIAAALAAANSSNPCAGFIDGSSLYTQVANAVEGFVSQVTSSIGTDLSSEWNTQLQALTNACTSVSTLESQGVSVFVGILQALADLVLEAAEAVVAAFLQMIGCLASAFLGFITQQITIPVVSDIYLWLTGNPLTFLDLFALLAAIPLTIIYKLLMGSAPNLNASDTSNTRLAATSSYNAGQVGFTFAMILYGIMDAGGDFAKEADSKALFAAGNVVTSFLVIAFFMLSFSPGLFSGQSSAHNQAFFGVMFFPIVLTMYGLAGPAQSASAANLSCMYGVIMFLMSIAYAYEWSSTYSDPDGLSLVGNLIGTISPIVKPFSTFDGPTLAIFDIFSDWGSGLVNIANWQGANS